jgi:hypothetical protein
MLTFDDCLGLCELTEDEIAAIRHHEHLPEIVALELGDFLVRGSDGTLLVKRIIVDDIERAQAEGRFAYAGRLKMTLAQFLRSHPERPD